VLTRWSSRPEGAIAATLALAATPRVELHRLFKRHYDRIWRLLRALGVPENRVDDATQQVFLVYAERRNDVAIGSESSFLYGTALRVAHNVRCAPYREIPSDVDGATLPDLPNLDELSDQKRARDLLDRILEEMDPDLRTVFVLYEVEEFTVPEIAEMTDVPLGTAASRLRRAREQFGGFVKRYETASNQGALSNRAALSANEDAPSALAIGASVTEPSSGKKGRTRW
jgi:RNA polymerase sigma-70 factor, ECF subfamily